MPFSGSDFGGFQFEGFNSGAPSQAKPAKQKKPRRAVKSPFTRVMINLVVTLAVGFVYFYMKVSSHRIIPLASMAISSNSCVKVNILTNF